jgi:hypothetical protein
MNMNPRRDKQREKICDRPRDQWMQNPAYNGKASASITKPMPHHISDLYSEHSTSGNCKSDPKVDTRALNTYRPGKGTADLPFTVLKIDPNCKMKENHM